MKSIICKILAVCITASCVLSCGHDISPEDRNQIEFRINNLAIQSGAIWMETCRSLVEDYGERAVPQLIEGLGATNAKIRRGCALCLGHIGSRDAVDPLKHHLGDPDIYVRLEAAASLCMLREYDGVPLLLMALRQEASPVVRAAAFQALREAFHKDFDYDPSTPPKDQEQAIQRWESWWEANSAEYLD